MAISNEKVNSRVVERLKKQGFTIITRDHDWEPIYVHARRNNIDATVFDGKVYFDENVVDREAGTFGSREIDFVYHWDALSDLKLGIGIIPNEIEFYKPPSLSDLVVSTKQHASLSSAANKNQAKEQAIRDYERHIVPMLEREEDIELNSTELDAGGEPIRETLFSVKSGWLQDYFCLDNHCQLEAFLTNSTDWDATEILEDARNESEFSGLPVGEVTEFKCRSEQKEDVIHLGHSMFLDWENIDAVLDRWAKTYFGDHTVARGGREETDFEVEIKYLMPADYAKFAGLFERYDIEHDYDPEIEFEVGSHVSILPVSITRGVMQEALSDQGLAAYGCSVATYDGVFFMERSKEQRDVSERKQSQSHAKTSLNTQIQSAHFRSCASSDHDGAVISVAHFVDQNDIKNTVLQSDVVRKQTLDLCYSIPGYSTLQREDANKLYDLVKKSVLEAQKDKGKDFER